MILAYSTTTTTTGYTLIVIPSGFPKAMYVQT